MTRFPLPVSLCSASETGEHLACQPRELLIQTGGSLGESEGLGGFRALEDVSGRLECLLFIVAGCDCGGDGFREAGVGDLDARGGFVAAEPGLV